MGSMSHFYFTIITLLLLKSSFGQDNQDKCRILALSGGGDAGSYQAGAIDGLIQSIPDNERQWDVVSGISIGALNALMVSIHEKGKESDIGKKLLDEWRSIESKETIYKNWPLGGIFRGLLYESGLYSTEPGYAFVNRILSQYNGLKRDYIIGAVDVRNGDYKTFTNKDFASNDDLTSSAMCSAAFPVIFPFGTFKDSHYMDGGVKFGTEIASAVHICEDKGFKHENIIIDVVLCSSDILSEVDPSKLTPVPILLRYFDIDAFSKTMGDLEDAEHFLPGVTFRYVVAPTQSLPSGSIPLRFSPKEIEEMIQLGQADAKMVVQSGSGVYYNQIKKVFDQKRFNIFNRRTK